MADPSNRSMGPSPRPTAASEAPTIKAVPRGSSAPAEAETLTGKAWRVDPMLAILYLAMALLVGVLLTAFLVMRAQKPGNNAAIIPTPSPASGGMAGAPSPEPTGPESIPLPTPSPVPTVDAPEPADPPTDEAARRDSEWRREEDKRQREWEREHGKREAERERERRKDRKRDRDDDDD